MDPLTRKGRVAKSRHTDLGALASVLGLALAVSCIAPPRVLAQDELTVFVNANAISKSVVEYVAKIGKLHKVHGRIGQSIADMLKTQCGRVDDNYVRLLRKRTIAGLPSNFTLRTKFQADTVLELPSCLKLPQYTVRPEIAAEGDSPWGFFGDDAAGFTQFGDITRIVAYPIEPSQNYLQAFAKLNRSFALSGVIKKNHVVRIPETPSLWSSISLRADLPVSHAQITATLFKLLIEAGQNAETIAVEDPEQITLFSPVITGKSAEPIHCQLPKATEIPGQLFDRMELVKTLFRTKSVLLANGVLHPDRVTIVLPDSGLYTLGATPFPQARLKRAFPYRDDAPYANIWPFPSYPNHHHGTYVATVAFGGIDFLEILEALDIDLKIMPIRILREKERRCLNESGHMSLCPEHRIIAEVFNNAIEKADKENAILNLSIGRLKPFTGLAGHLNKDSDILFVVAAGNDGQPLSERKVYPARYGGDNNDGRYNLITVAALNLKGTKAGFSNYGRKYVDIAAPGCLHKVLEYDDSASAFRQIYVSGTSFAAPLVSFASALVKSLWSGAPPRRIKKRLIAASDISQELREKGQVSDGRVLNIIKAVSLYHDVVEVRIDGKTRLIFGEIDRENRIFQFCKGSLTLYRKMDESKPQIKKLYIGRHNASQKPEFMIYWTNEDGVFSSNSCPHREFSLKIKEQMTGWVYELEEDDIIDIVFSERFH